MFTDWRILAWIGEAMGDIDSEIKAFEGMRSELEAKHLGEWVLVHDGKLIGLFESFELAADDAVQKFGRGPFLIRQVGAPPATLPISVMYAWDAER